MKFKLLLFAFLASCNTQDSEKNGSEVDDVTELIVKIEGPQAELIRQQIKKNQDYFSRGAEIPYYLSAVEHGKFLEPKNVCAVKVSLVSLSRHEKQGQSISLSSRTWNNPIHADILKKESDVNEDITSLSFRSATFYMNLDEIKVLRSNELNFSQTAFDALEVTLKKQQGNEELGKTFVSLLDEGKNQVSDLATLLVALESPDRKTKQGE